MQGAWSYHALPRSGLRDRRAPSPDQACDETAARPDGGCDDGAGATVVGREQARREERNAG